MKNHSEHFTFKILLTSLISTRLTDQQTILIKESLFVLKQRSKTLVHTAGVYNVDEDLGVGKGAGYYELPQKNLGESPDGL